MTEHKQRLDDLLAKRSDSRSEVIRYFLSANIEEAVTRARDDCRTAGITHGEYLTVCITYLIALIMSEAGSLPKEIRKSFYTLVMAEVAKQTVELEEFIK